MAAFKVEHNFQEQKSYRIAKLILLFVSSKINYR